VHIPTFPPALPVITEGEENIILLLVDSASSAWSLAIRFAYEVREGDALCVLNLYFFICWHIRSLPAGFAVDKKEIWIITFTALCLAHQSIPTFYASLLELFKLCFLIAMPSIGFAHGVMYNHVLLTVLS